MSHKLVDQVIDLDVGDTTAKLVLILIARHAHDDGTGCIAGQETLAKMAVCTPRTVYDAMVYLTDAGLIRRLKRFRKDGTRTSDETLLPVDTTGKIFRWSHADHRKKTTSTTGRKQRRPPEESSVQEVNQSEESVRGISKRGSDRRAEPKARRSTKPAALSVPEKLSEEWKGEAATVRPDLTIAQLEASYQVFKDHYTSGHTLGRWRTWIRREDAGRNNPRGKHGARRDGKTGRYGHWLQDPDHETTDDIEDIATSIDSTARAAPD